MTPPTGTATAAHTSLLWLLQVNDSQFPSGAYAHSMGLEGLVQRGVVRKPEHLEAFLQEQILPALCAFDLPVLADAHDKAVQEDLPALVQLDHELDAWKLAAEVRQASRQLGSRRLVMIRKLDTSSLYEAYESTGAPCHHLIITALELRSYPVSIAADAYAYQMLSSYAVAAMKLIRMGQERCQSIIRAALLALAPQLPAAIAPSAPQGWFNPLLEIASLRHAAAPERLFIS